MCAPGAGGGALDAAIGGSEPRSTCAGKGVGAWLARPGGDEPRGGREGVRAFAGAGGAGVMRSESGPVSSADQDA